MSHFPAGIVGNGNKSLYVGDVARDAITLHAVVHDAFGYLLAYHDIGPGVFIGARTAGTREYLQEYRTQQSAI